MKHDISKNTEIAASIGMSDFEVMGAPRTSVNIPEKVTSPMAKEIQKQRLTKPTTTKNSAKEYSVNFTRQG